MVLSNLSANEISDYPLYSCEYESRPWWGVLDYVIKFVSELWQVWFSRATQISSTNKTYGHDITEILLNVVFNTITLTH
jgi:hypothetical protein